MNIKKISIYFNTKIEESKKIFYYITLENNTVIKFSNIETEENLAIREIPKKYSIKKMEPTE